MKVKNTTSNPVIAIACVVIAVVAAALYANGHNEIAAVLGAIAVVAVIASNLLGRRGEGD